jgi:hypothetical protein
LRKFAATIAAIGLSLAVTGQAVADDGGDANVALYQKIVSSTVLIINGPAIGTGVVVDQKQGLIATANHVVDDAKGGQVLVVFPARDSDGKLIGDFSYYSDHALAWISATVLRGEQLNDTAILQLQQPCPAPAVPIVDKDAEVGQTIHAIGNSSIDHDTLWRCLNGHVEEIYQAHFKTKGMVAWMIVGDIPTNPGDSGGPIFNDKGELVGIVHGFDPTREGASFGVDAQRELAGTLLMARLQLFGDSPDNPMRNLLKSTTPPASGWMMLPQQTPAADSSNQSPNP